MRSSIEYRTRGPLVVLATLVLVAACTPAAVPQPSTGGVGGGASAGPSTGEVGGGASAGPSTGGVGGGASAGPSTGGANPTPAGNGAARIDACSALTVEEIEAQLGVEMKDGVPSGDNPEISTCTWESVDPLKGAAVVLTIEPYDPDIFEKWHDLATAENPEIPLPGIGDEAFVIGGTVLGGVTVLRKGGTEAYLGVIGAFLDRAVVEAARAPLAALVASRI